MEVELLVRFQGGPPVSRDVIEDALKDALEDVGRPKGKGKGTDIHFFLVDQVPEDMVLQMVRLTLQLVGVSRARISLNGTEYRFP